MTLNKTFSGEGTGPNSEKLVNERWQNKEGGARVYFPPPLVFLIFIALGVVLQHAARPRILKDLCSHLRPVKSLQILINARLKRLALAF